MMQIQKCILPKVIKFLDIPVRIGCALPIRYVNAPHRYLRKFCLLFVHYGVHISTTGKP